MCGRALSRQGKRGFLHALSGVTNLARAQPPGLLTFASSPQMADAMEMMILSILAPQLHCEWRLPSWQVALLTSVCSWQLSPVGYSSGPLGGRRSGGCPPPPAAAKGSAEKK